MNTDNLSPRQAMMVLNALPKLGPVTLARLLKVFGEDPREILIASPSALKSVSGVGPEITSAVCNWNKHFDLDKEESSLEKAGVNFVSCLEDDYPPLLKNLPDPPIGLYRKGSVIPDAKSVAIVGSRRTTLYGQGVARSMASALAGRGICVVSGMARGIDTCAHQGALAAGGPTAAVLGCGLDIIYPPENLDLFRQTATGGSLWSEFPFGTKTSRITFPMRNRLIAGMCRALIVVESDLRGGSMITASFASQYNRLVCAVPGRIDQDSSRGCHQLIRDGAVLLTRVEDLLEELDYGVQLSLGMLSPGENREAPTRNTEPSGLSDDENTILKCLREGDALHPDFIAGRVGLPVSSVSASLLLLELKRLVAKRADGAYEITYSA